MSLLAIEDTGHELADKIEKNSNNLIDFLSEADI